jgi:hypothetical protein
MPNLALLAFAADVLERLGPHFDAHTPYRVYHFLSQTPPALIIGVLTLVGVIALSFRRFARQMVLLCVLLFVLSFVALPSGREVIKKAIKLPQTDRPYCVASAIAHGAVWSKSRLATVKACTLVNAHAVKARPIIDSGSDGVLTGKVSNDSWIANVRAPAPTTAWSARSVDTAGSRDVYFETKKVSYHLTTCPSQDKTPAAWLKDKSGYMIVDKLYALGDPKQFPHYVTPETRKIVKARSHLYQFETAAGRPTGYLEPVSGAHGDCAVLTGPYRHNGSRLLSSPSQSELRLLTQLATSLSVNDLKKNF